MQSATTDGRDTSSHIILLSPNQFFAGDEQKHLQKRKGGGCSNTPETNWRTHESVRTMKRQDDAWHVSHLPTRTFPRRHVMCISLIIRHTSHDCSRFIYPSWTRIRNVLVQHLEPQESKCPGYSFSCHSEAAIFRRVTVPQWSHSKFSLPEKAGED